MKRQIRKCALFLYSILFCFSVFNVNAAVAQSNQPVQNKSTASNLFDLLKGNIEAFNRLGYYDSTEFVVEFPGNKRLVLDWGFKGAGNILAAFPDIAPAFVTVSDDSLDSSQLGLTTTFDWMDLAKVVAKNKFKNIIKDEIQNYNEYIPGFAWLLDSKATPVKVFALKLVLLMRHPFPEGLEFKRKIELLRLVFRLSQSKIHGLVDKKGSLLSYLPEELRLILEENVSVEWRQLVDDMWKGLSNGFDNYEFLEDGSYNKSKAGRSVYGLVFNNEAVAQRCYDNLSKNKLSSNSDLEEEIKKIVGSAYEVIEHKDYLDFHGQSVYKFIGYKDFGRINGESQDLPQSLRDEVLNAQSFSNVIKVKVSDKEIWLLRVSEKLSVLDALKLSSASLFKAFKEYESIKANLPELNNNSVDNSSIQGVFIDNSEYTNRLSELYAQRQDLTNRISGNLLDLQKAEKDLAKKNQKSLGTGWDKKLIQIAANKVDAFKEKDNQFKLGLVVVENKIKVIEKNPFNIFGSSRDSSNPDSSNQDALNQNYSVKNILKLIADTFISSPELSGMIDAVNSDSPYFRELKENLFKRIVGILKNTDNLKVNLEIYKYFVSTLFPEFQVTFEKLTQDLKEVDDLDDLADVFSSLVIK